MNLLAYAIVAEKVTKCYGEKKAVDGLSLKVEEGEFFGFLGPNGAGKTTSIKMILGRWYPVATHIGQA